MNYYIITGASRGIGDAITRRLIEQGNTIFAVSRTMNEDLVELASSSNVPLFYEEADLSLRDQAEMFIRNVFDKISLTKDDRLALINNAGMLQPVSQINAIDFNVAEKHFSLNLLAPLILSSTFLRETANAAIPKVILNITSGASFIPYSGWSAYCSSKSGLDMLTKVAGLEQNNAQFPTIVFALAPGIIETDMQEMIRNTNVDEFPEREKFIKLYQDGKLAKPDDVAKVIIKSLFSPSIVNGSVLSIEDLKKLF